MPKRGGKVDFAKFLRILLHKNNFLCRDIAGEKRRYV